MTKRTLLLTCLMPIAGLCACAQSDAMDTGRAVYSGVSPEASITLSGTEPFWGLEIGPAENGQHTARFTQPDDIEGRVFSVSRFAGNNGLGFSGELAEKPVQVAISPSDCSDGMSDRIYPFAATVAWGETTLLGCAYTADNPFTGPEAP